MRSAGARTHFFSFQTDGSFKAVNIEITIREGINAERDYIYTNLSLCLS